MVYQGKAKGLVFGEYRVLDKLGQGGMGVVLKARASADEATGGGEDDCGCSPEVARCRQAVLPRGRSRRQAQPSQHRASLRRQRTRRRALPGDGVCGGQGPRAPSSRSRVRCRSPRRWITSSKPPEDFNTPTSRASSTATSSPPICWWTRKGRSRSSTWGWHALRGWRTRRTRTG